MPSEVVPPAPINTGHWSYEGNSPVFHYTIQKSGWACNQQSISLDTEYEAIEYRGKSWRMHYNTERFHNSLGNLAAAEFALAAT